jgi:hypothetical protein
MKQFTRHARRKGPGRIGTYVYGIPSTNSVGSKLSDAAFNGVCTLRHGVGAAGRLALEGKLGKKQLHRTASGNLDGDLK